MTFNAPVHDDHCEQVAEAITLPSRLQHEAIFLIPPPPPLPVTEGAASSLAWSAFLRSSAYSDSGPNQELPASAESSSYHGPPEASYGQPGRAADGNSWRLGGAVAGTVVLGQDAGGMNAKKGLMGSDFRAGDLVANHSSFYPLHSNQSFLMPLRPLQRLHYISNISYFPSTLCICLHHLFFMHDANNNIYTILVCRWQFSECQASILLGRFQQHQLAPVWFVWSWNRTDHAETYHRAISIACLITCDLSNLIPKSYPLPTTMEPNQI